MLTSEADILIVPGLGNSGPDHWQSRWQQRLPTARRVEQDDWNNPDITLWSHRLQEEAGKTQRPIILVAHSFGAYVVAHAAIALADKVRGAFIVAPPAARIVEELGGAGLAELPQGPWPFKALVVASRDDEYGSYEEAKNLAAGWGADLADAGNSGHINAASGHGPWPEGLLRFGGFLKRL